jgi:STE24 endopeptidase
MSPESLTVLFVTAIGIETAARLWLATRQIAAVRAHRDRVPELFRNQIALADQQRAADYTIARARLSRVGFVVEASITLALTLGGGIALLDHFWSRFALGQPWHGALVVLTVLFASH